MSEKKFNLCFAKGLKGQFLKKGGAELMKIYARRVHEGWQRVMR